MMEREELFTIAQDVWSQVLGLELTQSSASDAAARRPSNPGETNIAAVIQVSGDMEMAVVLTCCSRLARKAAAAMLAMDPDETSPEDVQDAFGELANLVGGSIKNGLPGKNKLSVPSVAEGTRVSLRMAGGNLVQHLWLDCEGDNMQIIVFTKDVA